MTNKFSISCNSPRNAHDFCRVDSIIYATKIGAGNVIKKEFMMFLIKLQQVNQKESCEQLDAGSSCRRFMIAEVIKMELFFAAAENINHKYFITRRSVYGGK